MQGLGYSDEIYTAASDAGLLGQALLICDVVFRFRLLKLFDATINCNDLGKM